LARRRNELARLHPSSVQKLYGEAWHDCSRWRTAAQSSLDTNSGSALVELLLDNDGITHDNYFLYLIMNLPTSAHPPMSDAWHYIEIQRIIDENIDRFEREERWNELAKWSWFQKRLELSAAGFMKSFRESEPEALREMERRHEPRIRWGLP